MEMSYDSPAGIEDLLMECDEDELWWPSIEEVSGEEEKYSLSKMVETPCSPVKEDESLESSVAVPIPTDILPTQSASETPLQWPWTPNSPRAPLGFRLNGQPVNMLPGGEGTKLRLLTQPAGSASGFSSLQIPVTLKISNHVGVHAVNTMATLKVPLHEPRSPSPPICPVPPPVPKEDLIPIITGVVSGAAAEKVLSGHNVNFTPQTAELVSSPPPSALRLQSLAQAQNLISQPGMAITSPYLLSPPGSRSKTSTTVPKLPHGGIVDLFDFNESVQYQHIHYFHRIYKYTHNPKSRGLTVSAWSFHQQRCSTEIANSLKRMRWNYTSRTMCRTSSKSKLAKKEPHTVKFSKESWLSWPKASKSKRERGGFNYPDQGTSQTQLSPDSQSAPITFSPNQHHSEPPQELPKSNIVILVEDFYYGTDKQRNMTKLLWRRKKLTSPYHCIHCHKALRNNIKLMAHMKQHAREMSQQQEEMDRHVSCLHCYRQFNSPFRLQCHLEAVHSQCESTAKCQICELAFKNEAAFLQHMKHTHKPGEMPYICKVCDYRSSFYSAVLSHFKEAHADTCFLLCPYCLKLLRSSSAYQDHITKHQRKYVFGCDKCRLQFLHSKERVEHRALHHKTHVRPPQLNGLKPGTKVTVRTYSVVGDQAVGEEINSSFQPASKVCSTDTSNQMTEVPPSTPPLDTLKKPVESLSPLLSTLSTHSIVQRKAPQTICVECLCSVPNFSVHFPTLVSCSMCRYITCCSRAYANHMISSHVSRRTNSKYKVMYQSFPSLSGRTRCVSCGFSTTTGDMMAKHLTEHPHHYVCTLTQPELAVGVPLPGVKKSSRTKHSVHLSDSTKQSMCLPGSSPRSQGGAFIPIHLLPPGSSSTQLSVKPLTSPVPLSSCPAMTIQFLAPFSTPAQVKTVTPADSLCVNEELLLKRVLPPSVPRPSVPLSVDQLRVVLFALCNGLSQAAHQYQTGPALIQCWIRHHDQFRATSAWIWSSDRIAEWVLNQREQQLIISEEVLLRMAKETLGNSSQLEDWYQWAVDLMLHHSLSLEGCIKSMKTPLPRNVYESTRVFTRLLKKQLQNKKVERGVLGTMDELPVFINMDQFATQNSSAFRLFGEPAEAPLFDIVLSGLADGTFLRPVVFFRGQPPDIPPDFPDNVQLEGRPEGFTDQQRLDLWLNKVWRPRLDTQRGAQLIIDTHRGHLNTDFLSALNTAHTRPVVIPIGCSCRLQPLDVCITPVIRAFLQVSWNQLLSQGGVESLGLHQLALTLTCWMSEVASMLNSMSHILSRSFNMVSTPPHEEKQLLNKEDPGQMIQALTEVLLGSVEADKQPVKPMERIVVMEEEEGCRAESSTSPQELCGLGAVYQLFEQESDQESFYGFHEEPGDLCLPSPESVTSSAGRRKEEMESLSHVLSAAES
ncbi:pogo transposable element with ZNF domain [Lampris incognitus]|uniref:pogo transposable element with ZNF domain n=1 Tax=Lampris incognitus TaxID=2546036 RepID=UPI0024B5301D|nr:pogo transposable element with ZNF domain [Lampris incognitus]